MTLDMRIANGASLARAVRAYDAALTAWGQAATHRPSDSQRLAETAHAMDTAYRTMVALAGEGER